MKVRLEAFIQAVHQARAGIKLGRKSIKGKTKKVFSHGSSKAIDHIATNQLFPKILNDKEESASSGTASSGTKCIDFAELLERKNNDLKWVEIENVEKKYIDSAIDAVSRTELGLQAIPSCLQSCLQSMFAFQPIDSNSYNGIEDQDPHCIQANREKQRRQSFKSQESPCFHPTFHSSSVSSSAPRFHPSFASSDPSVTPSSILSLYVRVNPSFVPTINPGPSLSHLPQVTGSPSSFSNIRKTKSVCTKHHSKLNIHTNPRFAELSKLPSTDLSNESSLSSETGTGNPSIEPMKDPPFSTAPNKNPSSDESSLLVDQPSKVSSESVIPSRLLSELPIISVVPSTKPSESGKQIISVTGTAPTFPLIPQPTTYMAPANTDATTDAAKINAKEQIRLQMLALKSQYESL